MVLSVRPRNTHCAGRVRIFLSVQEAPETGEDARPTMWRPGRTKTAPFDLCTPSTSTTTNLWLHLHSVPPSCPLRLCGGSPSGFGLCGLPSFFSGTCGLDRNGCLDRRVRIIADQLHVFILKVGDLLRLSYKTHGRQRTRHSA